MIPAPYSSKQEGAEGSFRRPDPGAAGSRELGLGSAALSGRIYGPRGRPLEGATISLLGSGFWHTKSVRSGPDGRFLWPGIPTGIYELRASKGSLVAPPVEGLILDAGARRAFGIQLAEGWTLAGRVLDARDEQLIRNAEVTLATGALGIHTRRDRTDAQGRFRLPGVVGNELALYVTADGYVASGPLRPSRAESAMTVRLERASIIEGRVVDERGRPVEGATLRAFGEGLEPSLASGPAGSLGVTSGPVPPISAAAGGALAFVAQAQSDSDGSFVLAHLRPGSYAIAASHDDFASIESERVEVRAGATRSGIRVILRPGAKLIGTVVDERGAGLEGIPVELRTPGDRLPRMAVTASDGSFSFRGVRGEVRVTALPYDLPPASDSVAIGDETLVTLEISLSSTLYTLHGRVVDERDFGIAGALITASSKQAGTPVRRSAKSDVDGTFSVPALPEPPFELNAEHPGYSPVKLSDIESLEDVRIVMSTGVTLIGEARDAWTGEGLEGVRVQLFGPVKKDIRTRGDGTFAFHRMPTGTYEVSFSHPDYEPQGRRVVLDPPLYVDRPQELDTVSLEPGGIIEGEVLDAFNEPVAHAEVAWGDPPRWDRAVHSDVRGRFRLRGVPAGSVWLTARHPSAGESSSIDPITVRPVEISPGAFLRLPRSVDE